MSLTTTQYGAFGNPTTTGTVSSVTSINPAFNSPIVASGSYLTHGGGGSWVNTALPTLVRVSGDAEFDGDIKIKGVSLLDRLDAIEERLAILRPNNDLESKWEKLKALGDEYRALEKNILEKEKIWDLIKK